MQFSYKFTGRNQLENVSDIKLQNMEKTDEEAGYSTIDEVAQQEPDKTVLSLEIMLINVPALSFGYFSQDFVELHFHYVLQPR